jgi:hypothetical protein
MEGGERGSGQWCGVLSFPSSPLPSPPLSSPLLSSPLLSSGPGKAPRAKLRARSTAPFNEPARLQSEIAAACWEA